MDKSFVLVKTAGPTDPAWHAAHDNRIGGSRAASIMGVGYNSPMRTYLDMIGESDPVVENEAMYWGNVLEPVVAGEWAKRNGRKIQKVNAVLASIKYPRFIASVDRLILGPKAILEVKTTSDWMFRKWDGEELPDSYEVQARWYMMVTGLKEAYVAALAGGQKYVEFHITRDRDIEDMMIEKALNFIKLVDERTPPEVDGSPECTQVLTRLYPSTEVESRVLSITTGNKLERLKEHKANLQAIEEEVKTLENALRLELGDAEAGYLPGQDIPAVTWKASTVNRLDTKALRNDHPDICKQYEKSTVTRTLRIAKGE